MAKHHGADAAHKAKGGAKSEAARGPKRVAKGLAKAETKGLAKARDARPKKGDGDKEGHVRKAKKKKTRLADVRAETQPPLKKKAYEAELKRLQVEMVKLQYWVKHQGLKVSRSGLRKTT